MGLEHTIVNIKKNLEHSDYLSNIEGNHRLLIPKFVDIAHEHFRALEDGEEVVATDDEVFEAVRVLDLCKMILLEVPITDSIRELVGDVTILIYNWNQNVADKKNIQTDAQFIRNAIEMHMTVIELVQFTKSVMREVKKTYQRSPVQTDEISRHFLSAIDALQEQKECDCEDICV